MNPGTPFIKTKMQTTNQTWKILTTPNYNQHLQGAAPISIASML